MEKTIFAKSTGAGKAAISIYRLSGDKCKYVAQKLINKIPQHACATLCSIRSIDNELIDKAIVIFFHAPKSFTGEDCLEFHLHSSMAIEQLFIKTLLTLAIEPAQKGDFTKKAFENDKLNISQIESLEGVLLAKTKKQLILAHNKSNQSRMTSLEPLRETIIEILALMFAIIDFSDEEDIANEKTQNSLDKDLELRFSHLLQLINNCLQAAKSNYHINMGIEIALLGSPNTGKSTLFNLLLNDEYALTSDEKGTTRDLLSVNFDIGGYFCKMIDMAGIIDKQKENYTSKLDELGQIKALKKAKEAQIKLVFLDVFKQQDCVLWKIPEDVITNQLKKDDILIFNMIDKTDEYVNNGKKINIDNIIKYIKNNKFNKIVFTQNNKKILIQGQQHSFLFISSLKGTNTEQVFNMIKSKLDKIILDNDHPNLSQLFHIKKIAKAYEKSLIAKNLFKNQIEIAIENLNLAREAIDDIVAPIDSEDILDKIFSSFCIGK